MGGGDVVHVRREAGDESVPGVLVGIGGEVLELRERRIAVGVADGLDITRCRLRARDTSEHGEDTPVTLGELATVQNTHGGTHLRGAFR